MRQTDRYRVPRNVFLLIKTLDNRLLRFLAVMFTPIVNLLLKSEYISVQTHFQVLNAFIIISLTVKLQCLSQ